MMLAIAPGWSTSIGWVAPYHLAMLAGMLIGAAVFVLLARRISVPLERVLSSLPLAVVLPVAFARLFDMAVYSPDRLIETPFELLKVLSGGLSSHGAFLGLALLAFVLARFFARPPGRVADILVVWGFIGVIAARVGDVFQADGVGTVAVLPWSVTEERMPDGGSLPRHPVHLYEIGVVVLLLSAHRLLARRFATARPGLRAAVSTFVYFATRLPIDGVREVPLAAESPRIAVAQIMSFALAAAALVWAIALAKRALRDVPREERRPVERVAANARRMPAWVGIVVAVIVSAVLAGVAQTLARYIDFNRGSMRFPMTSVVTAAIVWGPPVFLASLLAGRLGGLLAGWKSAKARFAIAVPLFACALAATVLGMIGVPGALAAVLMVLFAVVMPWRHGIRDLVVFSVAGCCLSIAQIASSPLFDYGRSVNPLILFVLFGLASVISEGLRVRLAGAPGARV